MLHDMLHDMIKGDVHPTHASSTHNIQVVRYPWYTGTLAGYCPAWLTWLRYALFKDTMVVDRGTTTPYRYTAFIPLYPVGVCAELGLMYLGLPYMSTRELHSVRMPNALNFGFQYDMFVKVGGDGWCAWVVPDVFASQGLMCVYPLLWLQLYLFLWKQRGKRLRGDRKSKLS